MSPPPVPKIITSLVPEMRRGPEASLAPGRHHQKRCVERWREAGAEVISLNSKCEIERLRKDFPTVDFVTTTSIGAPPIPALLETGRLRAPESTFVLVNSDVEFLGDRAVLRALAEAAVGGLVIGSRSERATPTAPLGALYTVGFDLFVCDSRFVRPSELEGFSLGMPWWDYVFPFLVAAREAPLSRIMSPVVAHLTHDAVWSEQRWRDGLASAATALRRLAEKEGPAAAVFSHLCRNLEADIQPGYPLSDILHPLGAAVGLAMLGFVFDHCEWALWTRAPTPAGEAIGPALTRLPYD